MTMNHRLPLSMKAYRDEVRRREMAAMTLEAERDADGVRRRCQTFSGFVKEAWRIIEPGTKLVWSWHLDALCDHLAAITLGKLRGRLIINVPPGSSKSTIVSVLWQAWEWGPMGMRHLRYVSTSYDLKNVKRDTAKTLDVIKSDWFQSLWPEVDLKTEAVLSFGNRDTGTRLGVAFKSITGKRGDRLIVDDPHSTDGAESETQRDSANRRFIEGGLNRINDWESSAIVVVMQRLHERDLTGVLLARDYGFIHLMIPMEYEPERSKPTPLQVPDPARPGETKDWTDPRSYAGQLMDPARFPEQAVESMKLSGEYAYAGQYQQRPAPREGGIIKADMMTIVQVAPPGGRIVSGWDFAASKGMKSPYTVRVKMKRVEGNIYILHVDRRRTNPTEQKQMLHDVAKISDGLEVFQSLPQDPGQAGKAQKWDYAEDLIGHQFEITPEPGDKETRALPFAAYVGAGRVFLVQGDWNDAYKDECRSFPTGYKDQVDATSRAFGVIVRGDDIQPLGGSMLIHQDDPSDFAVL